MDKYNIKKTFYDNDRAENEYVNVTTKRSHTRLINRMILIFYKKLRVIALIFLLKRGRFDETTPANLIKCGIE